MTLGRREQAALLVRRREALVRKAQLQRAALAVAWVGVARPLRWLDLAARAVTTVRAHPWAVIVPLLAAALLRPRWFGRAGPAALSLARLWFLAR